MLVCFLLSIIIQLSTGAPTPSLPFAEPNVLNYTVAHVDTYGGVITTLKVVLECPRGVILNPNAYAEVYEADPVFDDFIGRYVFLIDRKNSARGSLYVVFLCNDGFAGTCEPYFTIFNPCGDMRLYEVKIDN